MPCSTMVELSVSLIMRFSCSGKLPNTCKDHHCIHSDQLMCAGLFDALPIGQLDNLSERSVIKWSVGMYSWSSAAMSCEYRQPCWCRCVHNFKLSQPACCDNACKSQPTAAWSYAMRLLRRGGCICCCAHLESTFFGSLSKSIILFQKLASLCAELQLLLPHGVEVNSCLFQLRLCR